MKKPTNMRVVDLSKAEPGAIFEVASEDELVFWSPIVREDDLYRVWFPRWKS